MHEYIDRQALLDTLPSVKEDVQISLYGAVADFIIKVNAIPAADAEPVRHGCWEIVLISGKFENSIRYKCSACSKSSFYKTDYCSNCGAKMDKEERK